MKRYFLPIFIFLISPVFAFAAAGDVVINEIMYDLEGADEGMEWIEIYNNSEQSIDLTGWKFNDGENHLLNVPPKNGGQGSMIVKSGEYLILAADAVVFLSDYPGFIGSVIDTAMSLKNPAATLTLFDKNINEINTIAYQKEQGANGDGKSLQFQNGQWIAAVPTPGFQNYLVGSQNNTNSDSQNSSSQNDNQSTDSGNISNNSIPSQSLIADAGPNIAGVVGAEIVFDGSKSTNSSGGEMSYLWNFGNGETAAGKIAEYSYKYPGRYIASLTVSSGSAQASAQVEVYVYPAGIFVSEFIPNPGGSDEEGEWIEIANNSDSIADISDFQLGDGSSVIFKIPKNTYIASRSFLVFARSATKISLNNDEDKIILYYPSGEIADSVEYKSGVKEGFSAARTSDGRFLWTKNSTPGTANIFLSEPAVKGSVAPTKKIVSENKANEFKIFAAPNSSIVGGQSKGGLISFLPEVSAKTVDGYDDPFDSAQGKSDLADARLPEDGVKTSRTASLIDSLKNKIAAVFILVPSIILSALIFVFRRRFWR